MKRSTKFEFANKSTRQNNDNQKDNGEKQYHNIINLSFFLI